MRKRVRKKKRKKQWRCFHCDKVFRTYEKARRHFGNTSQATTLCVLQKCLCLDCPCMPMECQGRSGRVIKPGSGKPYEKVLTSDVQVPSKGLLHSDDRLPRVPSSGDYPST